MKNTLFVFFMTALLAKSYAQKASQENLAMFQNSPAHLGIYPSSDRTKSIGSLKWKFKTGDKIFSSPVVAKGIIYIGSEDHYLYALSSKNGSLKWKFKTNGNVDSSPAVFENVVYFGSFDGYFFAVNRVTGKLVWKFKTGGEKHVGYKGLWGMTPKNLYMEDQYDFYLSSPLLNVAKSGATVYFGSSDGNLYALNAHNGNKKWAFKSNGIIHSSPALDNGIIYVGSWDTYLYAIDADNGKLKWKYKTKDHPVYHQLEGIQASPTCYQGAVYFGCRDGNFYSLNEINGKLLWKVNLNGSWAITTAAAKEGTIFLSTSDTYLFLALNSKTGVEKFRLKANGYIYSSTAISGNTGYFGDFSGKLLAINLSTGKLVNSFATPGRIANGKKILNKDQVDFTYLIKSKDTAAYTTSVAVMDQLYKLGPIVSSPAIKYNTIYFGSSDGYLYALNLI